MPAFDASNHGAALGTSLTISHTCTGSGLVLVAFCTFNSSVISGVTATYNGTSMTSLGTEPFTTGNQLIQGFILPGPATGTHNVVFSCTNGNPGVFGLDGATASYTGAKQSTTPDSQANANSASATTFTPSTTVVSSNCWLILGVSDSGNGIVTNNANTTVREAFTGNNNLIGITDSNAVVGTGSQSQSVKPTSGSALWQGILISLAPNTNNYTQNLAESATLADTLPKATTRTLSQSLTIADVLSAFRIKLQTLVESFALSDTVNRGITRALAEALTVSSAITRTIGRALSETTTLTDSITRSITRVIVESLTIADSVKKFLNGLLAIYSNKYRSQGTSYGNKHSSRGSSYQDKYQHPQ